MAESRVEWPNEHDLMSWSPLVSARLKVELEPMAARSPSLIEPVKRLIDTDPTTSSPFRLLPFAISGALKNNPDAAIPLAILSRIWWLGAEIFDDLNDGKFDSEGLGISRSQAAVVSTACLTAIPSLIIKQLDFPEDIKLACEREYSETTLAAAGSQLDDVSTREIRSWGDVMRIYSGKSGAPYERDTVLAALLSGASEMEIRGWRAFGRLFGVLRQLANDRSCANASEDEDLINGTWTLLLALAMEVASPQRREEITSLRIQAAKASSARFQLSELLQSPEMAHNYNSRIRILHGKISSLLSLLAEPTKYREKIQWMIDVSTFNAFLSTPGAAI